MKQLTFTDAEASSRKDKKTRTEIFLDRMDRIIPWHEIVESFSVNYYEKGKKGRQPYDLESI